MRGFKLKELNRKINISISIAVIILLLIISITCLFLYIKRNKVYYVHYDEKSDLDYKVALKENDYFEEEYLEKDNQYIASLIDYIDATFKYNLNVKEDIAYNYDYKIVANVDVVDDKTNKTLYTFSENVLEEISGQSDGVLDIEEHIKIDYNKYNDKISDFVNTYNLSKATSKLNLKMYVGIDGDLEELNKTEDSVISLEIPLTTNTVAIDASYDLSNNVDNLITLKPSYQNAAIWRNISAILFVIDVVLVGACIKYAIDTETEEDKYNGQLKKILNNYGSYISKVEDEFDMQNYQILKVANFIDLLEIRDTIHIPIIMIEKKEQFMTYFIIPTANNILYFYSLGAMQYALPVGVGANPEIKEDDLRGKHAKKI